MSASRHARAGELFIQARELHGAAREQFLDQIGREDLELCKEVASLLASESAPVHLLDHTAPGGLAGRLLTAPPDPWIGRMLGRYHIRRVIAAGGMGTVYEAAQERPRRTVALKMIRQGVTSLQALRRFEFESQILAHLQHPGIAQVFEANVHEGPSGSTPYFVMEYLPEARPITEYADAKRLDARQRMELLARVCDAVQHGHHKGIVHRDLKPGNVLIDQSGHPKVIDFGVARATDLELQMTTPRTDAGQIVGTIAYMSPEQIAGDSAAVDTRSDVYALGVLLYELLAGQPPQDLRRRSIVEAARIIREDEPTPLRAVNPAFRGDIETIVSKALEKDRNRRYQSAGELALDIRRHISDEPILARPASAIYQLRKFARRNRGMVAGLAVAVGAIAVGVAGVLWFALEASRQARRAARESGVARQRFDQVRDLARTFIFDIHDQIRDLPGATRARQTLVDTALTYLDALRTDAGEDPGLRWDLATAYAKIGDVQGFPSAANLGDVDGALASYQRSLGILEGLPDGLLPEAAHQRAVLHDRIGSILQTMGRIQEAAASCERSLAISRNRLRADAGDLTALRDMALACLHLGDIQAKTGRSAEALTHYHQSLEMRQRLAGAPGADGDARLDLSVAFDRVGDAEAGRGHSDAAMAHYNQSLQIRAELAAAEPHNATVQNALSTVLNKIAAVHQADGRLDHALTAYREALEIRVSLAEADPENVTAQRNVSVNYENIGDVEHAQGRDGEALGAYQASLAINERLARQDPENATALRDLALSHTKIGNLQTAAGHADEALASYRRGLDIRRALAEQDPANLVARRDLLVSHSRIGNAHFAAGRVEEALASYQASVDIARTLAAADPGRLQSHRDLAINLNKVGDMHLELGDLVRAAASFQEARDINQVLADSHPDNIAAQRGLAATSYRLAKVHAARGADPARTSAERIHDWRAAQDAYRQAHSIFLRFQAEGRLAAADADIPARLAADIDHSAAALAELQQPDGASAGPGSDPH